MILSQPAPPGLAGERADVAAARLFGLSRTRAAELAQAGRITIDGRRAAKSARLEEGQSLAVDLPEPPDEPEPVVQLPIVHQDADLIVIDKPVGVAAHAGPGWAGPTVLGSLLAAGVTLATGGPNERRGIVQRLDVGTSGLMMVAKSERAYSKLKQMFRSREVAKTYHALVQGLPDPLAGTIDGPIGRLPGAFKFAVVAGGKPSVTHYELIEAFAGAALLEVGLETGRTHQIRVHLAAVGHPLVGDPFYGGDPKLAARLGLERQWLHAAKLEFDHPATGLPVRCESPRPSDLEAALGLLRAS
ncbi:MAG: RluA family pseudouridine synthase [Bifidobacteriaceae bacterium]|jgi:23S rRNA pseudouridine1911/1915/1917 synthase|nr:RluA family pseudouridine synthase [Bifidobacteriaceae bacterium]